MSRPRRAEDADLVILNTCHIREKAAEKVYSELGRLRVLKEAAAREGRQLHDRGRRLRRPGRGRGDHPPRAGGRSRGRPADLSSPARSPRPRRATAPSVVDTEFPAEDKFDRSGRPERARRSARAASPPSSPCRKAATSSAPSASCPIRAAPKSRARSASIVAEAERLADAGVREITLLGQNVNAYHGEGPDGRAWTLGRLLHRLAEIPGIARLRYTTSHPRDMDDDLIAAHRDLPSADALSASAGAVGLRPHSGGHEPQAHARRLSRHRSRGCARRGPTSRFTSDFIVGFPGETDADFADTLALVDEVGFAGAYLVQIFAAPRHAGRRDGRPGRREAK